MAGQKWSERPGYEGTVHGNLELMVLDPQQPNASERNFRTLLGKLRDYITGGLPIPPPDTEWVTMPTVLNDGADPFKFNVSEAEASFAGETVPYGATSFTVPAAGEGLKYVFLIYAKPDGTYGTVSGPQSQNPAVPSYPTTALYVSHATITETGGEVQEPIGFITESRVLELLGNYYTKPEVDALIAAIEPGTTSGQATAEAASTTLNFANPFGHIRNDSLTGAQTFTKQGSVLGATVVQSYTSTGPGALSFDFPHTILNSDFTSGDTLAAGEYKLFFSNWGDVVAVSIASVRSGVAPTPNTPPTANAGPDQSITLPTNSVTLSGSGTDADGTITGYQWTQVSGPSTIVLGTPDSATATASGLVEGSYVFRLTVTDDKGATASDDITITVHPSGTPEDTTPPTAPQNIRITNVTTSGYTATADPSTDS